MYLPRTHPLREMLAESARGRIPSRADLDALVAAGDAASQDGTPSLARFRSEILDTARKAAALHAEGAHKKARDQAEEGWCSIADRMSDEQRALSALDVGQQESLSDIGARMFGAL